jgi:hypothetical protein
MQNLMKYYIQQYHIQINSQMSLNQKLPISYKNCVKNAVLILLQIAINLCIMVYIFFIVVPYIIIIIFKSVLLFFL